MSGLKKIQSSKNVLVFPNKTTTLYEMPPNQYNCSLKNNITKRYRKTALITETRTDKETRKLSKLARLIAQNRQKC